MKLELNKYVRYNKYNIHIEHHTDSKHIKWNSVSGVYFAREGDGDSSYGALKHSYYIKPNTKIFQYESTYKLLDDMGILKEYNKDIVDKYGKYDENIVSIATLYDYSGQLYSPNDCYMESQLAAMKILNEKVKPDVCHFTYEDDLTPEQFIILNKECLSDRQHLKKWADFNNPLNGKYEDL